MEGAQRVAKKEMDLIQAHYDDALERANFVAKEAAAVERVEATKLRAVALETQKKKRVADKLEQENSRMQKLRFVKVRVHPLCEGATTPEACDYVNDVMESLESVGPALGLPFAPRDVTRSEAHTGDGPCVDGCAVGEGVMLECSSLLTLQVDMGRTVKMATGGVRPLHSSVRCNELGGGLWARAYDDGACDAYLDVEEDAEGEEVYFTTQVIATTLRRVSMSVKTQSTSAFLAALRDHRRGVLMLEGAPHFVQDFSCNALQRVRAGVAGGFRPLPKCAPHLAFELPATWSTMDLTRENKFYNPFVFAQFTDHRMSMEDVFHLDASFSKRVHTFRVPLPAGIVVSNRFLYDERVFEAFLPTRRDQRIGVAAYLPTFLFADDTSCTLECSDFSREALDETFGRFEILEDSYLHVPRDRRVIIAAGPAQAKTVSRCPQDVDQLMASTAECQRVTQCDFAWSLIWSPLGVYTRSLVESALAEYSDLPLAEILRPVAAPALYLLVLCIPILSAITMGTEGEGKEVVLRYPRLTYVAIVVAVLAAQSRFGLRPLAGWGLPFRILAIAFVSQVSFAQSPSVAELTFGIMSVAARGVAMAVIARGGILSYGADLLTCLFLTLTSVSATRSGLGLILSALLSVQATTIPDVLQGSAFEKARVAAFGDSDIRVWVDVGLLFGSDDVAVDVGPYVQTYLLLALLFARYVVAASALFSAAGELPLVVAGGNARIEGQLVTRIFAGGRNLASRGGFFLVCHDPCVV